MDISSRNVLSGDNVSLRSTPGKQGTAHHHGAEMNDGIDGQGPVNTDVTILLDQQSISSNDSRKSGKKEKRRREPPKIVLNYDRTAAQGHFLLFHALPMGVAIALIVVNIQGRFYGIDGRWIPAFQFGAKGHELTMQMSIGAVIVAYLRYLLTHKNAVPFGAVFSAYNIKQISYLWSREFRGAVSASHFRGRIRAVFILFVPFSILLTASVGPSSAIAMQPRQVNFTVPSAPIAFNVTSESLYPETLARPGPSFFDARGGVELSPASGWQYLLGLPSVGGDSDFDITTEHGLQQRVLENSFEFVMPQPYAVQLPTYDPGWKGGSTLLSSVRTLYVQYAPNSTFATVSHVPVSLALELATPFVAEPLGNNPGAASASIEMPQAFASVLCQLNTIMDENDTRPIQFPDTYVSGCGTDFRCSFRYPLNAFNVSNYTATTRKQIWDEATQTYQGQIIWVDDVQISSPVVGTSLGAIVIQPARCGQNDSFLMTSACVIGARWANATLYQQRSFNEYPFSNTIPAALNSFTEDSLSTLPQWSQTPLSLSKAWASSLNPLTTTQNRTVADNLLRALPITEEICPPDGSYPQDVPQLSYTWTRPFMHEALLASLVVNGLSHAAGVVERWLPEGSGGWGRSDGQGNYYTTATPPGLVLSFQGRLPGYAWNLDGAPIKIALVILILYCLYAGAYVGYTCMTGRSSTTWSAISDLAALALGSRPPEGEALENTSAGITRVETFRKLVSVREVGPSEKLELVFLGDMENLPHRRVAVGKAY